MRKVLVKSIGTDHTKDISSQDKKKIKERLVSDVAFKGLHKNLKIFVKDEPGENYLIYWNYELLSEIKTSCDSFYYRGKFISGDTAYKYPQTITYDVPDHGIFKVVERGDIKLIYKESEHVGNISWGGDLISLLCRIWKTKKITLRKWYGFEYDEDKIDHVIAASLFMNVYSS